MTIPRSEIIRRWRIALRVRAAYDERVATDQQDDERAFARVLDSHLAHLNRIVRRLTLARERSLMMAVNRVTAQLEQRLANLEADIAAFHQQRRGNRSHVPALRTLLDEITSIDQEFDYWVFDRAEDRLSVTVGPITLEGIGLGRFRIDLPLGEFAIVSSTPDPYWVVPLEPYWAGGREDVPHPHVQSDHLCAGDACYSIRRALEDGRLCDFFMIVRSVLETYNPGSPFVSLEEWDGTPCANCGYVSSETYVCASCDAELCTDCGVYCRACEVDLCADCAFTDDDSGESLCEDCAQTCDGCGSVFSKKIMSEGLCPSCAEEQESPPDNAITTPVLAGPHDPF